MPATEAAAALSRCRCCVSNSPPVAKAGREAAVDIGEAGSARTRGVMVRRQLPGGRAWRWCALMERPVQRRSPRREFAFASIESITE